MSGIRGRRRYRRRYSPSPRRIRGLEITEDTAWTVSRVARALKHTGQHIGDNDGWQAAIAIEHALPLVSGNARHFARVPGLRPISHRPTI